MFKKMRRNIYISLILPATLFVVLTVAVCGLIVSNMLYDIYVFMVV